MARELELGCGLVVRVQVLRTVLILDYGHGILSLHFKLNPIQIDIKDFDGILCLVYPARVSLLDMAWHPHSKFQESATPSPYFQGTE